MVHLSTKFQKIVNLECKILAASRPSNEPSEVAIPLNLIAGHLLCCFRLFVRVLLRRCHLSLRPQSL